jgi:hypothetical protein
MERMIIGSVTAARRLPRGCEAAAGMLAVRGYADAPGRLHRARKILATRDAMHNTAALQICAQIKIDHMRLRPGIRRNGGLYGQIERVLNFSLALNENPSPPNPPLEGEGFSSPEHENQPVLSLRQVV